MKICSNCGAQAMDDAAFCGECSAQFPPMYQAPQNQGYQQPQGGYQQAQGGYQQAQGYQYQQQMYNPYDHTAEFDPKDISDNKVISMLVYLLGAVGIVIALLAANNSPYVAFHLRQALKIVVVQVIVTIFSALTAILILPLFAASIISVILLVVKIICFFQICQGKAVEAPIIRNLKFLS
ncbi:MAG: zinc ribbon domain-containing protein [Clostridia bacterium]|nr:zinc ribbon domain-containing protein [Clostridia bacterium]